MATNRTTSRVFAVAVAARDALRAAPWPSDAPAVGLSAIDPSQQGEFVQVVPVIGEDASITWRTLPGGRDERFDLEVRIVTNTGHMTEDAAIDRAADLCQVVERTFYDDLAANVAVGGLKTLVPEQVKTTSPSSVSFEVGEFSPGSWGVAAVVTIPIYCHI